MFRNPRENASPTIDTPLRSSTGRPPTPPGSIPAYHSAARREAEAAAAATMTTRSSTNTLTPRASTKTNITAMSRQGSKKTVHGKTPSKPNSSILNFFKKVDSPLKDDSIFLTERANGNGDAPMAREYSSEACDLEVDELIDNTITTNIERFNEAGGSVKRRKLSNTHTTEKPISENDLPGLDGSDDVHHPDNSPTSCIQQSPEAATTKPTKRRQTGPFLDDSDSEDDVDDETAQHYPSAAEEVLKAPVSREPSSMNNIMSPNPVRQEAIQENNPVIPALKSLQSVSRRTSVTSIGASSVADSPGSLKDQDQSFLPRLKKEDTSIDDFAGFEDLEEFPDDEYADGEEFIERKWMEEQAMLEAAEDMDEGLMAVEPAATDDDSEQITAACPICNSRLCDITADQATRHVNACLDGNPIPLPTPIKRERSEAKLMPIGAKHRFSKAAIARPGQENPFQLENVAATPSSAFSKLMSSKAEDAAWVSAAAAENASRGKPAYQRTCPFYKIMPGFFICVDAFRYGAVQGCNAYFLSHFHSDHYIGLTSSWCHGPIYCSKVTANLVKQQLRVDSKWVVALNFEERVEVPGTQGVAVTMIPANHCPGSSLYLFEKVVGKGSSPKVQRVLHCGDFRACPAHIAHPMLMPDVLDSISGKTKQQKIDVCYLDTTYLNPRYAFPSQDEVIKACADMCVSLKKERAEDSDAWEKVKKERAGQGMTKFVNSAVKSADDSIAMEINSTKPRGRLLVICGTYSIGKERICMGIARALDCKIWAPPGKMKICAALEDPELMSRMTDDPKEAQIHMQMLMEIRAETLQDYLNSYKPHFSRIVGFRPSGWNYKPPNSRSESLPVYSRNPLTQVTDLQTLHPSQPFYIPPIGNRDTLWPNSCLSVAALGKHLALACPTASIAASGN
ncbi:DRMBL-domain-containing protein [Coleophoma cylindrospora]|uniref:DRMBL-domain-containing protein n=1 Tax=Coleophoma cylindrospora TaxID=1849047 RepID=A0A3D8SE37_9HELO|nr:DRMBL-domain-containing protein [Coleophoma cylindrospora]